MRQMLYRFVKVCIFYMRSHAMKYSTWTPNLRQVVFWDTHRLGVSLESTCFLHKDALKTSPHYLKPRVRCTIALNGSVQSLALPVLGRDLDMPRECLQHREETLCPLLGIWVGLAKGTLVGFPHQGQLYWRWQWAQCRSHTELAASPR